MKRKTGPVLFTPDPPNDPTNQGSEHHTTGHGNDVGSVNAHIRAG